MEAIRSSETSVQSTTSTRRHTPEDGILHSHRHENLKSYILNLLHFLFGKFVKCALYETVGHVDNIETLKREFVVGIGIITPELF
jgi:hypothetical protein